MKKKLIAALCTALALTFAGCGAPSGEVKLHGEKIDLSGLLDEWIDEDCDPKWVKDEIPDLVDDFLDKDIIIMPRYGGNSNIVPFSTFSKCDEEDHEPVDLQFARLGDELACISITSGTGHPHRPEIWDMVLPDGTDSDVKLRDLKKSKAWLQTINRYAYGDIYKTSPDLLSDFGEYYVCIYLDGKLVQLSDYEEDFEDMLDDFDMSDTTVGMKTLMKYWTAVSNLHTTDMSTYYLREQNASFFYDKDTMKILKNDVITGIAINDCLEKLLDGDNEELMILRVGDVENPNLSVDIDGLSLSCTLIKAY